MDNGNENDRKEGERGRADQRLRTQPDAIVTGLLRHYSRCDALRPDGRPW